MDHEVVTCSPKWVIGRWTCPDTTLVHIKEETSKSDHGTRDLHNAYFPFSTVMVQGFRNKRGKRGTLAAKGRGPWQRIAIYLSSYLDIDKHYCSWEGKKKGKEKNRTPWKNSPTLAILNMNLENQYMHLLVDGHSTWSMFGLHHSPTLGAHTHAHAHAHTCPWVLGGHGCDIIVHGWA